ncbi:hypothetical protein OBBRIDRAFT_371097 [Obba rivulosa]|uniref:Uncharacterized protein n=1 Tax=Obba rivulosa TaxID=1052685 RepID=A0A8E2AY46_9APHY|nr:hypothetical protein OBBRIDRAFT_371097 [Obba rivulosa]
MSRPRKLSDALKLPESIKFLSTEKSTHPLSRKNSDSWPKRGTRPRAGSISKADIVHMEAGNVKDGFTQFMESQACQAELSAAKKVPLFERPTGNAPEEHMKAAHEFYGFCDELLSSPVDSSGAPVRPCRSDEDVGKRKLEAHEKALARANTTVGHVRSPSQTRPLNVITRKRSLSIDSILRTPAPSLFSRSKRNRVPTATPVATAAASSQESGRPVGQVPARPPRPPPLHRTLSSDPVAPRMQVLRAPEHRRATAPEPPAAPKVSQSWYTSAKPVSPPHAPADQNRVLRCDERRSTDGVQATGKHERPPVHQCGNSAQELQQHEQSHRSHETDPRRSERLPNPRLDRRQQSRPDEERVPRRERFEQEIHQQSSGGRYREASRQQEMARREDAESRRPNHPAPILGESSQRRHRQQSPPRGHAREPGSQDGHASRTNSFKSISSLKHQESYVVIHTRADHDRHREHVPQGPSNPPNIARLQQERSRQPQPQRSEGVKLSQALSRTTTAKEAAAVRSPQSSDHGYIPKAHSRQASHSSQNSTDSVGSGSVYSQPSTVDSARRGDIPSSQRTEEGQCPEPEISVRPVKSKEEVVKCYPRMSSERQPQRVHRTGPSNITWLVQVQVQKTSSADQDVAGTVGRVKLHPPVPDRSQHEAPQIAQKQYFPSLVPKRKDSEETVGSVDSIGDSTTSCTTLVTESVAHLEPAKSALKRSNTIPQQVISEKCVVMEPLHVSTSMRLQRSLGKDSDATGLQSVDVKSEKRGAAVNRAHTRRASESDYRPTPPPKSEKALPPLPPPMVLRQLRHPINDDQPPPTQRSPPIQKLSGSKFVEELDRDSFVLPTTLTKEKRFSPFKRIP